MLKEDKLLNYFYRFNFRNKGTEGKENSAQKLSCSIPIFGHFNTSDTSCLVSYEPHHVQRR